MKKSELKDLLDAQRYYLVALNIYLSKMGLFPSKEQIIETNLDDLWLVNEIIGESFKFDLVTPQEIVKTGMELVALNDMYSMEIDENTKIN